MSTGLTSFDRAEAACAVFLGKVLNVVSGENKDVVRDDWLDPTEVNRYAFSLSGGPEQVQNFGVCVPGSAWYAFGQLLAQFESRADAIAALGKLQNGLPARRANNSPGLVPNVRNFEILEHPEIFSQLFTDESNTVQGRIFILRVRFRVVYDNTQD